MELLGAAAPDGARVRLHHPEVEARAGEDAPVGVAHRLVAPAARRLVEVEGVGVLHDELARPHDPEAGPDLIPELGLDLVEVEGKLAVAADLPADDVGDDLLVGWAHAEVALVPVAKAQQLRPEVVPAARLHPQLRGLHRGHEDLLGPRPVHLLADDVLDLAQHPETEREPGVEPGREPAHEAGPDHEPVAHDLGVGGVFPLRGEQDPGGSHRGWVPGSGGGRNHIPT